VTIPVAYPRHPAHLDAFVEELGPAMAVRFLIEFGGARLYFPNDPRGRSRAEALIGADNLRRLGQRMPSMKSEIPIANTWLIQALTAEGKGTADICRLLRVSARTVKSVRRDLRRRQLLAPPAPDAVPTLSDLPLFAAARKSYPPVSGD
jgi:hypothetical protein